MGNEEDQIGIVKDWCGVEQRDVWTRSERQAVKQG
jgi:hypothetical protein